MLGIKRIILWALMLIFSVNISYAMFGQCNNGNIVNKGSAGGYEITIINRTGISNENMPKAVYYFRGGTVQNEPPQTATFGSTRINGEDAVHFGNFCGGGSDMKVGVAVGPYIFVMENGNSGPDFASMKVLASGKYLIASKDTGEHHEVGCGVCSSWTYRWYVFGPPGSAGNVVFTEGRNPDADACDAAGCRTWAHFAIYKMPDTPSAPQD